MENVQTVPVEEKQPPWGFWPTIGLSVVVYLVSIAIAVVVLIVFAIVSAVANPGADAREFLQATGTNGFIAFLAITLAAPLCIGLVLLFIKLRATLPVKEYLRLTPTTAKTAMTWFGALALLLIASGLLSWALDRPVPEIMLEYYRTSPIALSWFAIILAAPVFEEVLFRGFMFRGIQASSLGDAGAILITAALWAIIHFQYDAYLIATIFALGILFGAARAVTGSLYLATAMHVVVNLIATVEMHFLAGS